MVAELALVLQRGRVPTVQRSTVIPDLLDIGLPLPVATRGVSGGLSLVGEGVSTETRLASWQGDPSTDGSSSSDGALLLRP